MILTAPPRIALQPAATSPGWCHTVRRNDGALEIQAEANRNAYLVLSENFYPGWHALLDGKTIKVERADYLVVALPLSPGIHTLVYRYQPWSFRLGAMLTAFMLIAGGVVAISAWRAQRS